MFTIKVSSKLRATLKQKFRQAVNEQFVSEVNQEVVGEINRMIDAGVSPVDGYEKKRFAKYKDKESYPAKKKANRPVNLFLTGEMRAWYEAVKKSGTTISIGIPSEAPEDVKARAEANNVGTTNSNGEVAIAPRRFVPLVGEKFAVSVIRALKRVYTKRVKELVSKK
jgi:hypothetical protein